MQSSIRFKAADLGQKAAETGIKLWYLHIGPSAAKPATVDGDFILMSPIAGMIII